MIHPHIQIQDINDTVLSSMSCICMFGGIIYVLYLYVWSIIYVLYLYVWSIIYVLYLYVWVYHLCLVFVCLGISFMSCICMFGCIIYILYLYVWEYHLCHINNTPKHTNTRHKWYSQTYKYKTYMIHPNIQIQDINDTPKDTNTRHRWYSKHTNTRHKWYSQTYKYKT
jgi:hypothetical protein